MADERVFVGDLTRKEFRQRIEQGIIKAAPPQPPNNIMNIWK